MRRDDARLLDMLLAARKIQQFTAGLTQETFQVNELVQSAVIREIQVIGEAARLVTQETRSEYSQLAWATITGMRNRVIHEYFNIDLDVVWETIQHDIPDLIKQLEQIVPPEE